ncbi:hypothetical protein [Dactylosporangium maewongense]|uniref:hypothetical protein n=1 Tax=Dactylosporangium maewongense TaxID=634393 RepID=UPI0031D09D58
MTYPSGNGEKCRPSADWYMPVPFEFARVVVPSVDRCSPFYVFAPQHLYADHQAQPDGSADATRVAFPLDETAKYFKVLVALCEPRLRDPSSPVIRTSRAVLDIAGVIDQACPVRDVAVATHGQVIEVLIANRLTNPSAMVGLPAAGRLSQASGPYPVRRPGTGLTVCGQIQRGGLAGLSCQRRSSAVTTYV